MDQEAAKAAEISQGIEWDFVPTGVQLYNTLVKQWIGAPKHMQECMLQVPINRVESLSITLGYVHYHQGYPIQTTAVL